MSWLAGRRATTVAPRPRPGAWRSPLGVVEVDDREILGRVQLAGLRVLRLQHLGVLVVSHRLRGVELVVEQQRHVEGLLHQLAVHVHVELLEGGGELELVPESPGADPLSFPVRRRGDPGVRPRHLEGAAALEDLGDVDQVGLLLVGHQSLGHPRQPELRLARGHDLLGHDVHRPLGDLDLEPLRFVEALVDRGEVAGELRLGHPLQLERDRRELAGSGGRGSCVPGSCAGGPFIGGGRPRPVTRSSTAGGDKQQHDHARDWPRRLSHHPRPFRQSGSP